MTINELRDYLDKNKAERQRLEQEAKDVTRAYCLEAMEKAGYHIGDTITEGDKTGIIVDAELFAGVSPRLIVVKIKKDGTPSMIRDYHLCKDVPNIKE